MLHERDALITGIGLISCLGEGTDAHWAALNPAGSFAPVIDETSFAPWLVHPMAPLELDRQIPKRGDQRQMEAWQRIGTYAAGLALDQAGVKQDKALLSRMDMIVAAGGGEREYAVDEALLSELHGANDPGVLLKQRHAPVWARQAEGGGMVTGSVGSFLVIESRAHAAARGATPLAHVAAIQTARCRRNPGEAAANAAAQIEGMRRHFSPESS